MDGNGNNSYDMPIGLSFQLGMNTKAMEAYAKLNDEEKLEVVDAARNVADKSEMHQIVRGLERDFC